MKSMEARGPQHPEEKGGAIEDMIPGKIPDFLFLRVLRMGHSTLPLELLNLMFGKGLEEP